MRRASLDWSSGGSRRDPRRTALGTVRVAAIETALTTSASDTHAAQASTSPVATSTIVAAIVPSIAAATKRFIGRAVVVTRR
jgi:hypothetical protein